MLAAEGPYTPWIHLADNGPRPPGWSIHQRVLSHYLLVVSYEGGEQNVIDGAALAVPRNGAYLVQPGVLTQLIASSEGSRPSWVHFDVKFNARREEHRDTMSFETDLQSRAHLAQPSAREVWGVDLPVLVPPGLTPLFARSLDPIVELWRTGDPYDQIKANHELGGLLLAWVESARPVLQKAPLDVSARIRRAEAIARERLAHSFDVEEFAQAAGFSRAHFSKVYKEHRGLSPGHALRNLRLETAEHLLVSTGLGINDVARLVGYPDSTVFSRSFRQRHGTTPTDWRQRRSSAGR